MRSPPELPATITANIERVRHGEARASSSRNITDDAVAQGDGPCVDAQGRRLASLIALKPNTLPTGPISAERPQRLGHAMRPRARRRAPGEAHKRGLGTEESVPWVT